MLRVGVGVAALIQNRLVLARYFTTCNGSMFSPFAAQLEPPCSSRFPSFLACRPSLRSMSEHSRPHSLLLALSESGPLPHLPIQSFTQLYLFLSPALSVSLLSFPFAGVSCWRPPTLHRPTLQLPTSHPIAGPMLATTYPTTCWRSYWVG